MPRYIDADMFAEQLRLNYCKDCNSYNGMRCRACEIDDALDFIEDAPTADVAPKSETIKEYLAKVLEKKDIAGHFSPGHAVVSVSVLECFAKEFTEGKNDV